MKKTLSIIALITVFFGNAQAQNWNEIIKTVASDREVGDQFGYSVAISGDHAIVGAYFEDHDDAGLNMLIHAGSAYLFERNGAGIWNEVQKIVASDRGAGDLFGNSVAISGDYAIVGANLEDEDAAGLNSLNAPGSAYLFERNGAGIWNEVQKIVASDRELGDQFGQSVAISGNYAIIGANLEDDDVTGLNTLSIAGSAYLFERNGVGIWNEAQKIVASDRGTMDQFGHSVAISGNYAIVGARFEGEDAAGLNTLTSAGSAYLYERNGAGIWNEVQKIVASDREVADLFGCSIAISGDYAIVGAYHEEHDDVGLNTLISAGSAYLFERNGAGIWNEVQKIVASDRDVWDILSWSVAISGNYAIVGAYHEDEDAAGLNTLIGSGSAYLFERNGAGIWNEVQKIVASDRGTLDQFGHSVAISGDYAIVGARFEGEDAAGLNTLTIAGSAYIFTPCLPTDTNFNITTCSAYIVPSGDETYTTVGTYQVMDTIINVCGGDSIMTITVTILPPVSDILNSTICFGDSVVFNGNTYDGINNTGNETFTAANGCDSVVTITVIESPLITGTLVTTICFGDSFIFNGTTYNSTNLTGLEVLTAYNGCDSIVTVNVTEKPLLSIEISTPDTLSCEFSTVTLFGTTTFGYATEFLWTTPSGTIISSPTDSIAEVSILGNYSLNIVNNFGCTANTTIIVYEDFTTPVTTDLLIPLCDDVPGLPLEVTVDLTSYDNEITNDDGVSEVEWFYDVALNNPIINPTNFTTSSVNYFILATNPKSKCTNTAKVNFLINRTPQVAFTSNTVCEGFKTTFLNHTVSFPGLPSTVWEFGDGSFSNLWEPEYIFSEPGIHNVSLTITNDKQCTESFSTDVEVFANPIADFTMTPNPTTMLNSTVNFINQSTLFTTVDTFKWTFGEISSSILKDPTYSFSSDTIGKHIINLEVTDQNGCKNSKDKFLSILGNVGLYIPTAFSPNGDGLNDIFIPSGFGILDDEYSFMIFDRWGSLIFESHNKKNGWDGTYKGMILQTDTYVWKLNFLDLHRVLHSEIGQISLIK